jgi:hypothetical protein
MISFLGTIIGCNLLIPLDYPLNIFNPTLLIFPKFVRVEFIYVSFIVTGVVEG